VRKGRLALDLQSPLGPKEGRNEEYEGKRVCKQGKGKKHIGDVHSDGVRVHLRTPSKLFVRLVRFAIPFYISYGRDHY